MRAVAGRAGLEAAAPGVCGSRRRSTVRPSDPESSRRFNVVSSSNLVSSAASEEAARLRSQYSMRRACQPEPETRYGKES
jgi:hypothetical protein